MLRGVLKALARLTGPGRATSPLSVMLATAPLSRQDRMPAVERLVCGKSRHAIESLVLLRVGERPSARAQARRAGEVWGSGVGQPPREETAGRADGVSNGVVLWGFQQVRCAWKRGRWRRDVRARRAGRLGAELEVAFWEVEPDSGRAFDRRRQRATGPATCGAAPGRESVCDLRWRSWRSELRRRGADVVRARERFDDDHRRPAMLANEGR